MKLLSFRPQKFLLIAGLLAALSSAQLLADDTIYTQVDEKPVPVKTPPPRYPDTLRRDGVAGMCAISIVIDEKGTVVQSTVAKSTHPEFEKPALEAVERWKFKPAKKDGNAVKVKVTVPLRFSVEE